MTALSQLRALVLLEGASLLVLVFVAMPLKHIAGYSSAVRVVGSIHGLLFLLFAGALFRVAIERRWRIKKSLAALGASVVPFGAFYLDRSLRREGLPGDEFR